MGLELGEEVETADLSLEFREFMASSIEWMISWRQISCVYFPQRRSFLTALCTFLTPPTVVCVSS